MEIPHFGGWVFQGLSLSVQCLTVVSVFVPICWRRKLLWWWLIKELIFEYIRISLGVILSICFFFLLDQYYFVFQRFLDYWLGEWKNMIEIHTRKQRSGVAAPMPSCACPTKIRVCIPGVGCTLVHLSSVFSHSCLDLKLVSFIKKKPNLSQNGKAHLFSGEIHTHPSTWQKSKGPSDQWIC